MPTERSAHQAYGELPPASFRPLTIHDLPVVLHIERQCHAFPWSEGVFTDCFRHDYRLLAIELALMYGEAHLLNLCILPRWQGKGLARRLLRAALRAVACVGMARVILEVRKSNLVAQELYRTEGFQLIGERPDYYPAGGPPRGVRENALVMSLEFPAAD